MRVFFGWVFLVVSSLLVLLQFAKFASSDVSSATFIVFLLTIGSAIGSSLVYSDYAAAGASAAAGALAMVVCVALVLFMAFHALDNSRVLDGVEYFVLILYAVTFAIVGVTGINRAKK